MTLFLTSSNCASRTPPCQRRVCFFPNALHPALKPVMSLWGEQARSSKLSSTLRTFKPQTWRTFAKLNLNHIWSKHVTEKMRERSFCRTCSERIWERFHYKRLESPKCGISPNPLCRSKCHIISRTPLEILSKNVEQTFLDRRNESLIGLAPVLQYCTWSFTGNFVIGLLGKYNKNKV